MQDVFKIQRINADSPVEHDIVRTKRKTSKVLKYRYFFTYLLCISSKMAPPGPPASR